MDLGMFGDGKTGELVPIAGTDSVRGPRQHCAFLPDPLPEQSPDLSGATYRIVANARAALAALDSTARQLPNPRLLRRPTLRLEAQSTSALEGTYEPLERVLVAAADPTDPRMREVINYELMAEHAFLAVETQRPVSVPMLCELQKTLVTGTPHERPASGRVSSSQVVVGRRSNVPESEFAVVAARFVPPPPGLDLEARLRDLMDWLRVDRTVDFDPLVASAMVHYQFETLHPFHDGNGRLGRLLIVLQLYLTGTLSEPTLTVSPWFESRRSEYQDRLLAVSTRGDWDGWTAFFASGLAESATASRRQMLALVQVQAELKDIVRTSKLRADTAHALVDFAVSQVAFTVREVERGLLVSYGRANQLVDSLVKLGILRPLSGETYNRRFYAPRVLSVLLETGSS